MLQLYLWCRSILQRKRYHTYCNYMYIVQYCKKTIFTQQCFPFFNQQWCTSEMKTHGRFLCCPPMPFIYCLKMKQTRHTEKVQVWVWLTQGFIWISPRKQEKGGLYCAWQQRALWKNVLTFNWITELFTGVSVEPSTAHKNNKISPQFFAFSVCIFVFYIDIKTYQSYLLSFWTNW